MGIASQDLTGDGLPEVYLTSQGDNKPPDPCRRTGPADLPRHRDSSAASPPTGRSPVATILPSTAWHPEFQDVNNDGFTDLFVSKGNVDAMPEYAAQDPNNLLLGQPDGTFVEGAEAAGIVSFDRGRGAALADLNLDGLLDLVEVNRRENVKLWRNVGAGTADAPAADGQLARRSTAQQGAKPRRDRRLDRGEGRRRDQRREVTVGGGHAGGQLGWIHFGLGPATRARGPRHVAGRRGRGRGCRGRQPVRHRSSAGAAPAIRGRRPRGPRTGPTR